MYKIAFFFMWWYIFSIPWESAIQISGIGIGSLSSILGIMVIFFTGLLTFERGYVKQLHITHLLLFILFIFLTFLSLIWSINIDSTFNRLLVFIQLFITILAYGQIVDTKKDNLKMIDAFLLGTVVIVIAMLFNFIQGDLYASARYSALGRGPITNALLLCLGIPFAWYSLKNSKGKIRKNLILLYIISSVFCILITGSRTAFIGLLPVIFYFIMYMKTSLVRKIYIGMILGVSLIVVLYFIPDNTLERLFATGEALTEGNFTGREDIWGYGINIFMDNKLFGIGVMTYALAMEPLLGKTMAAHNIFITVLVEQGLLGIIFLLLLLAYVLLKIWKLPEKEKRLCLVIFMIWLISAASQSYWEAQKSSWFIWGLFISYFVMNKNKQL